MNPSRAILLKLGSVAVFVSMQSLIKATSGHIPPGEAVFFRSFFALPVILLWLHHDGGLADGFRTSNPIGHLWRGLLGASGMGLSFAALGYLPLPEATAIFYAGPILVVIFAAMFLNEKVGIFRLSAVGAGMAGVLIILAPRLSPGSDQDLAHAEALGAVLALMSAVFAALAQTLVRKLVATEKAGTIVLYFSLTASLLSLSTLAFGWVVPTPREAAFLVLAGLAGGVGQGMLTSAYRFGDASLIAPFDYASMLLAVAIGYMIFNEIPNLPTIVGAAIVVSAGIAIILRERHLGIKRERQRRALTPGGQ
ncbi:DMT family transporter [Aliiruegeria sabulilitoris]|uniref:DMT family transporter n=1 Tax=Aliiruegeria sabulilitoris TaxID=1510458 RepID=UPI00082DD49F|nr:DMT family transporter [Aliiruegeria sabulilitoris]NDR57704.1 DMT family transporter [Pseudoruegeria sp. M32A2M]